MTNKSNIKNIILDVGHGGLNDKGIYTTAPAKMKKFPNGEIAYEGVINRNIGLKLGNLIKKNTNLNVIYTVEPSNPTDVSLGGRVRFTNQYDSKNTILISIHNNASLKGDARGFEIFTTKGVTKSDKLAEYIAIEVEKMYKQKGLKVRFDMTDGDRDKESDFYIIKNAKCPAVLIECLFFDNYEDYKLLIDNNFQDELVSNIYKGIMNYVNVN